jgi:hypothetical protein
VTNTPADVDLHFNDLLGGNIGVDNLGTGTVDATQNWWGCAKGPSTSRVHIGPRKRRFLYAFADEPDIRIPELGEERDLSQRD